MRQRELSEREQQIRPIPGRLEMTVRTADKKADSEQPFNIQLSILAASARLFIFSPRSSKTMTFAPGEIFACKKLCLLFLRRIVLFLENHIPAGTLDIFVDNHRLRRIFLHLPMAKTVAFISFLSSKTLTVKYICPTLSTGIDI